MKTTTLFFALLPIVALVLLASGGALLGAAVISIGMAIGIRSEPSFSKNLIRGLLAGTAAGLLILGPGLRLAMRVVAIMDPFRRLEFTLGGTFFIVLVVGGAFGAVVGVTIAFARQLMSKNAIPVLGAGLLLTLVLGAPDLRAELIELGAGGWFNVPLFGLVGAIYALAVDRLIERSDTRGGLVPLTPVDVQV